jgi:hypothetical protein
MPVTKGLEMRFGLSARVARAAYLGEAGRAYNLVQREARGCWLESRASRQSHGKQEEL